jgi:predicted ATPase
VTDTFDGYATSSAQSLVKHAMAAKSTMRMLCDQMHHKHPGMSGADMARVLATMGFNFFTASTVAQEWRKARNMKGTV